MYSPKRIIHVEMKNQIRTNTVNAISNRFSLSIQLFQWTNLWGNSKHLEITSFSRNKTTIWPSNLIIKHIPWGNQNWKRYMCPNVQASLAAQLLKNLPAMQETWVRSLGWGDPMQKGKATHSSIQTYGSPGLYRHNWVTFTFIPMLTEALFTIART